MFPFAIEQYLRYNEDYKGVPVYNELIWQPSVLIGAPPVTREVQINIDKGSQTTFILVHYLQYSLDGLGGTVTFTDSRRAVPMIEINNNVSGTNIVPFPVAIRNNRFNLVCNNINILFSLAYQRVTQELNQNLVKK